MNFEHPLAYLLGVEGVALLRAYAGEFGDDSEQTRAFVEARIAEVRRLLRDESLERAGVEVDSVSTADGYRIWSQTYDDPGNGLIDTEEPYVREIITGLKPGTALDAACGTGRISEFLVTQGHHVIGVDGTPEMLARARARVPSGDFRDGDLHRLPVGDNEVDLVVCTLALTHVAELPPVMAEFARVLRPGGHMVLSDAHHELILRGAIPNVLQSGDRAARLSAHRHLASDYLRAALPLGLRVLRCEEPRWPRGDPPVDPGTTEGIPLGPWRNWPWSLGALAPVAAWATNVDTPIAIIWQFRLDGPTSLAPEGLSA
jgi:SAM-dependent methyltransferase